MRVLVGDIGGTKTQLALAQVSPAGVQIRHPRRYASAQVASLGSIVRAYLDELGQLGQLGQGGEALGAGEDPLGSAGAGSIELAALAVAGPVHGNRCRTTNLPWELDADALAAELELPAVALLNDLEAIAWAVPGLRADELLALHCPEVAGPEVAGPEVAGPEVAGPEVAGPGGAGPGGAGGPGPGPANACVIAAGTGLGVAGLCWDGRGHRPFATEAGHAEFAPTDELEFALTRHLRRRYGRVSWERVVSGQGIVELFEFLLRWRGAARPSWLDDREPAAMIAHAAERGGDPVAVEAMDLFARLYARFIGDLALAHMAVGGVYLAGGVTASNLRLLTRPGFLDGVFGKGRMDVLLRRAPIQVITQPDVALIGAARFAAALRG